MTTPRSLVSVGFVETFLDFPEEETGDLQNKRRNTRKIGFLDRTSLAINDRFNQRNMLRLAIVGLIITVIVKLIAFS